MTLRGSRSLIWMYACVALVAVTVAVDQACDKTKCPGPLAYYKALGCKPVYEKENDCCATRYNCDHLYERSKDKCYVNGKTYEIGEKLKDEDANPCDMGCFCNRGYNDIATFTCAVVDCFNGFGLKEECYIRHSLTECCAYEEICPEKPEDRATCEVDGTIYKDGEYFSVKSDPELNCICQPGYEGKNVEPFCVRPKRPYCSPDFRHASDIFSKCAPVYYPGQSPQTGCGVSSRCQNNNDKVIHANHDLKSGEASDKNVCHFGNMTMHRGEELNQATDYSSVCVKCVCEVPPVPTCQQLPDTECDVTNHPSFPLP
ncbi:uncharacterized protein LOC109857291 isoform X2 [Pseudomyrmex gracilis]|uniref:uncharacterized protein LOC109857291 isoform X2 n=1 Tax=Pseudomyrmex gracilis TaxID=219809 RepID=UPI0009958CA6|nr:uncharacterized protein LOC109857291 isoform X2 [Pseudomyrmex gracilis]